MRFQALPNSLLLLLAVYGQQAYSADDTKTKPVDPCTAVATTGSFYDLRPLTIKPSVSGKKSDKNEKVDSWHAKGYDYNANFTLNICAPVVEELEGVVGVDSNAIKNVSAYYSTGGEVYSLGYAGILPMSPTTC